MMCALPHSSIILLSDEDHPCNKLFWISLHRSNSCKKDWTQFSLVTMSVPGNYQKLAICLNRENHPKPKQWIRQAVCCGDAQSWQGWHGHLQSWSSNVYNTWTGFHMVARWQDCHGHRRVTIVPPCDAASAVLAGWMVLSDPQNTGAIFLSIFI